MSKYIIRIESTDPSEELRAEYRIGIPCEGFAILIDAGKDVICSIENMSRLDMAQAIFADDDMMAAAIIARGLHESNEIAGRARAAKNINKWLERMAEGGGDA